MKVRTLDVATHEQKNLTNVLAKDPGSCRVCYSLSRHYLFVLEMSSAFTFAVYIQVHIRLEFIMEANNESILIHARLQKVLSRGGGHYFPFLPFKKLFPC